jgi:hypothetical protein
MTGMSATTTTAAVVEPTPAARFLKVLGELDFAELERCLAPDVWFRALLPRKVHESNTAQDAVSTFRAWFQGTGGSRLLEADHHTIAGRQYVRYRFLVRPEWARDQWHVVEQAGFCRVKENRVSRLDLVCTGFFPWRGDGALVHESGVRFRKGRPDWMDEVESPSHLQGEIPRSELGLL